MSSNGVHKGNVSILIIDDDENLRDVFEEILKRNDYSKTFSVGTGELAKEKFANEFFNIAIIDLNLPDINGMDLISQLRTISPDTEFIIVTGFGSIDYAIKAIQFEVGGFLEKPISTDKLIRTIEEVSYKQFLKLSNQQYLLDLGIANKEIRFLNDLLVNNVDELNQSLLLTIVQIEKLEPTPEQRKVLQLFQESIRKNARLTRNIKKLQQIPQPFEKELVAMDLTQVINSAVNRLREDYSNRNFECQFENSANKKVLADSNLAHLITEILLIAILNDPSPRIKIAIEFEKIINDNKEYWKISFHSFQSRLIYDQRDVKHPSDLEISITEPSFQDLGPFIVNQLINYYNGYVSIPEDEAPNNRLDIFLHVA
ncbi:MAG: response regulator [Candidatus Thorarchaeota archaeon]